MYLRLFSVFRGEFWVSVLQGEVFFSTVGMRTAVMLYLVCVCVCNAAGVGGEGPNTYLYIRCPFGNPRLLYFGFYEGLNKVFNM